MNSFIDLSSNLSSDYEKLYDSGRYTDISIHVGKEPNSKIFLAHTVVLCTRSKFIENSLTENKETSDAIQKTVISFEDVSPDVFEMLLRYIYTGRMSYDLCKNLGWFSLLDGASKFELVDLLAAVELHKYAASTVSLNRLLAYCNRTIVSHPDVIFKSNEFATLPKETLITFLKNDELDMDEDAVWMSVIQWATKQVPELELGTDPDNWSSDDTKAIKDIVADCLPYIRFLGISYDKVIPYDELLPKKLRHDILTYYANKDYKPNTQILPPRIRQRHHVDSVIISKEQAEWISSKIVESTRRLQEKQATSINKDDIYKLTLLYRCSRDGILTSKFRQLCNGKGPTVSVGKVLGTEEILGGYNPLSWGFRSGKYTETKESFIFALGKNMDKHTVSFVIDSPHAIFDANNCLPDFGNGIDLFFGRDNGHGKPYAKQKAYQFPIRSSSDNFEWADWEVFLVSKV